MDKKQIGVLFDLDGVLIDTETQYSKFWGAIGEKYFGNGKELSENIKGRNLEAIYSSYFPDENIQKIITAQLDEFQANMSYELYPGVKEFLDSLVENKIAMCIVTSSDDKKMERLFESQPYLKSVFTHMITGDQVTNAKPHPECFLKGAALIGRDIHDCYVFEDSINGITAGLASGAKVIAIDNTYPRNKIAELTNNIISGFEGLTIEKMLQF